MRARSSRVTGVLLAAAWLLSFVALGWWLRTPAVELRERLKVVQFWSLEICLTLLVVCGGLVLRELRGIVFRADAWRLTMLAAAALALTIVLAPRTNRIYYDEHIYQAIGQNLTDLKLAQICNDGTVEYGRLQCWSGEYNKQPYAYPHLLSVLYRVFGVHESVAFWFNPVAMALTACGVYLLVLVAFEDRTAALFSATAMLLIPEQLLWSATAASEPSASLACVAAVLFAAVFVRSKSTTSLAATAVATAYAVQFRAESMLIVPVVGLMLLRGLTRHEWSRTRLWVIGLVGVALVAVHLGHLSAVRNEGWGTSESRLSLGYVAANLRSNGWFYVWDERFPSVLSFLALIGLSTGRLLSRRIMFALYFLLFVGIDLMFYAGSYNYGADVRYSVMTFPPIAVLSGLGVSQADTARRSAHASDSGYQVGNVSPDIAVLVVRAGRARDHGRSVGGARRRAVCAIPGPRCWTTRVRADAESRRCSICGA